MNYEDLLTGYTNSNAFTFSPQEDLKDKCNAPNDKAGVYLIFEINGKRKKLLYIGSSGQRNKEGKLKIRKGGLFDRLVNGFHPNRFGKTKRIKRRKAFPEHMMNSGINKIEIKWWVTHHDNHTDFPTDIEKKLTRAYLALNKMLPEWHKRKD